MEQPLSRESTESIKNRELWENPAILSVTFRRHGEWSAHENQVPKGALTPTGIKETKEIAKQWTEKLPENSNVSIFESPSFMPATAGRKEREVLPRRASITASIYEKAIFGKLAKSQFDKGGERVSSRRNRRRELGDFLESAEEEHVRSIPDFFKLKTKIYGDDQAKFWEDFVSNNLPEELHSALMAAGGSDTNGLAQNFMNLVDEFTTRENSESADQKEVILAITHGETLESFLYKVRKFIESKGGNSAAVKISFDYNEGVDLHLDHENLYICSDDNCVGVSKKELRNYIFKNE